MKKIVIMGPKNSGKTTIADYIESDVSSTKFYGDIIYRLKTIEIPSNYLENNWLKNIVIMISQNQGFANILVLNGNNLCHYYSPNFAKVFTKPTLGIITKADLMDINSKKMAINIMNKLGCNYIFVSFKTGDGLLELGEWILKFKEV